MMDATSVDAGLDFDLQVMASAVKLLMDVHEIMEDVNTSVLAPMMGVPSVSVNQVLN
jgi:hypothetical protein